MSKAKKKFSRPIHVLRAIIDEDTIALKAMGRKGAETRKQNARRKKEREAEVREIFDCHHKLCEDLQLDEFYVRAVEANEHICPVDDLYTLYYSA